MTHIENIDGFYKDTFKESTKTIVNDIKRVEICFKGIPIVNISISIIVSKY